MTRCVCVYICARDVKKKSFSLTARDWNWIRTYGCYFDVL